MCLIVLTEAESVERQSAPKLPPVAKFKSRATSTVTAESAADSDIGSVTR